MGFFKEFKEFIMRGNVVDMAVGVVIGAAFGKIVTSLVNDIVMPPIGLAIGGVAFSELKAVLKAAELNEAGEVVKEAVTLNYGNFIQTILEFIIIALCIFLIIRSINKIRKRIEEKKQAEEAAKAAAEAAAKEAEAPAEPQPTEAELLAEIRDLLRKEKNA